jgi:hypothetical protein
MNKDEALRMALEALKEAHYAAEQYQDETKRAQAITAIREALAQPEQEPDYRAMYIKVRDELAIEQQR